ncbi:MAG: SRPBCC domain-containing protein [Aliihoeflea sp.]
MTNFTTTITVGKSPADAFRAILDPRSWWGAEIEGETDVSGQEWTYRYKELHFSRQRTVELIPDRKIVWEVVDARMSFLRDTGEWTGTKLEFELEPKGEGTQVRFTHIGLVPKVECFDVCTDAWTGLIQGSLKNRIETGVGDPDSVEKVA